MESEIYCTFFHLEIQNLVFSQNLPLGKCARFGLSVSLFCLQDNLLVVDQAELRGLGGGEEVLWVCCGVVTSV